MAESIEADEGEADREPTREEMLAWRIVRVNTPEDERQAIRTVANRWRTQYDRPEWWTRTVNGKIPRDIHRQLAALDGETATVADVVAIMGGDGWLNGPDCSVCCDDRPAILRIGDQPDYEARYVNVCADCLIEVVRRSGIAESVLSALRARGETT